MRQVIIGLNLFGAFIVYALTVDLFETGLMFLLFGILPGRAQPLPASEMFAVYSWAAVLVLAYSLRKSLAGIVSAIRAALPKQSQTS